jgi:hypothetical protein
VVAALAEEVIMEPLPVMVDQVQLTKEMMVVLGMLLAVDIVAAVAAVLAQSVKLVIQLLT